MGEERSLAGLIAVTLALGLVAAALALWLPTLTLAGGLSVDTYEADYALDGSLAERYVYNVEAPGTYRMLFRTFDDPLVFNATASPHIELVGVEPPDGVAGYARDASGAVRLYGSAADPGTASFVAAQAELNEVGLVDTGYFSSGTYEGRYGFVVRPPVEYDASFVHVNLKLAREGQHVPYSFVRITLPADNVSEVFAYPPTLQQTREGDRIVITGSAAENENVAIEPPAEPLGPRLGRGLPPPGRRRRGPDPVGLLLGDRALHALDGALLGRDRVRAPRARRPPPALPAVRPGEGLHRARVPEHGPRPDEAPLDREPPLQGGRRDLGRRRVLRDRARPAPARADPGRGGRGRRGRPDPPQGRLLERPVRTAGARLPRRDRDRRQRGRYGGAPVCGTSGRRAIRPSSPR